MSKEDASQFGQLPYKGGFLEEKSKPDLQAKHPQPGGQGRSLGLVQP